MINDIAVWYKNFYNMVFRQCRRILKSNEEAEDATHDVFEKLLKTAESLHINSPAGLLRTMSKRTSYNREKKKGREACWLYTLATHVSLKRIREKNMTAKELLVFLRTNVSPAPCDGEKIYSDTDGAYDQVEAELLVQAVLNDKPEDTEEESEKTRTICYMRYSREMTLKDIGEAVGLSKSAVKKRLLKFEEQARLKLGKVSPFMLEMYSLDIVSGRERKLVEKALSSDRELSLRYAALKESNQKLDSTCSSRSLSILNGIQGTAVPAVTMPVKILAAFPKALLSGVLAATVLSGVFFSFLYHLNKKENRTEAVVFGESLHEYTVPALQIKCFPIVSAGVCATGVSDGEFNYLHIYNNRGLSLYGAGDYAQAIQNYNKAIEIDSGYVHAYNNRGLAYYAMNEYDRAITDYNKAIEIDSDYIHAYNNRGLVYYTMSEYDRAIMDYTSAIEIDHSYTFAYNNRGMVYYAGGEYEYAIRDYTDAMEIGYAFVYNNRGNAYSVHGEKDRAIKDYAEAIRLDPHYARPYYNLGNEYYRQGDYNRAIENYTEAIRLDPQYAYTYNNRGNVYYDMGSYDRAIADFDRALVIDPGYALAYTNRTNAYKYKEEERQKPK
jgi:RNA polymerase sigma factor (sigma-70 family)